jgi:hypothetical protein
MERRLFFTWIMAVRQELGEGCETSKATQTPTRSRTRLNLHYGLERALNPIRENGCDSSRPIWLSSLTRHIANLGISTFPISSSEYSLKL